MGASPNNFKKVLLDGNVDWTNQQLDVALGGSGTAYTFDPVNHTYVGDVFDGGTTAQELSDTSYDRQTLGSKTTSQDDTDNEGVANGGDVTFPSLDTTQDIQFIMLFHENADGSGDATNPIYAIWDDDSAGSLADLPLATNGSDVTISWSSEGIINIE